MKAEGPKTEKKNFWQQLNRTCSQYAPAIQAVGIATGLLILCLTYQSTRVSQATLSLMYKQESQKILPIWDFETVDSLSIIRLKPFNPDIKIQRADAVFSKELMDVTYWPIDQPRFEWHLTSFKAAVAELFSKQVPYKSDYVQINDRAAMPVGLDIHYIQYGESRRVTGLFLIDFMIVRSGPTPTIMLKGVLFDKYVAPEDLQKDITKLTKEVIDPASES